MGKLLSALLGVLANHLIVLTLIGFVLVAFFARDSLFAWDGSQQPAEVDNPAVQQSVEDTAESETTPSAQDQGSVADPIDTEAFRPLEQQQAGSPVFKATSQVDASKLLEQARAAFWQRDFAQAERHYAAYLAQHADDANALGELANVYHKQGKIEQALDAYFAAGMRFKALGQQDKLNQIIDYFQALKDPRAQTLSNFR